MKHFYIFIFDFWIFVHFLSAIGLFWTRFTHVLITWIYSKWLIIARFCMNWGWLVLQVKFDLLVGLIYNHFIALRFYLNLELWSDLCLICQFTILTFGPILSRFALINLFRRWNIALISCALLWRWCSQGRWLINGKSSGFEHS